MSSKEKKEKEYNLPKRSFNIEFVVGIFTLIGVLCFGYLSINIAGVQFSNSDSYNLKANFDNVSGLNVGSSVEIAGVEVGEVLKITLEEDETAMVTFKVYNYVKVHDDDIAVIRTKGIIGEKYIRILPGSSDTLLTKGEEITDTESVVDFEEIIGKIIHNIK